MRTTCCPPRSTTRPDPDPNDQGLSRKHILSSIDASLRRLGTDYVDLYQIHRWDEHTPIAETMAALHDVVQAGKARYLGASSMYAWQFSKAQHTADLAGTTRFVSMQNHYNLLYREEEREMIPLCHDQGVGLLPYSPLARGLLAGTRNRGTQGPSARAGSDPLADDMYNDTDFDVVDAVRTLATARGVPPARIALAWLLSQPGVSAPIVGATKISHLHTRSPQLRSLLPTTRSTTSKRPTAHTRSWATPDEPSRCGIVTRDHKPVRHAARATTRGSAIGSTDLAADLSSRQLALPVLLDDAVAAVKLSLTVEEAGSLEKPYVPHPGRGHH